MAKIITSDDFLPKPSIIQKSSADSIIEGINNLLQNPIVTPFIQSVTQLIQVTIQNKVNTLKTSPTPKGEDVVLFSND